MTSFQVFQIYYDEATRSSLDAGYLPLDNRRNERPDWYEFWVIRNFLRTNSLAEDGWYGFLSPHFQNKTGLTSRQVHQFLDFSRDRSEVALILYAWDQVAYFLNPFEQGEVWHPGITALSQSVLRVLGHDIDLARLVTYSGNFTFSNYIIAKPAYWREWLTIADRFFDLIENQSSDLSLRLKQTTSYGSLANQAPFKTFIQERLPAVILSGRRFRTSTFNTSQTLPIFDRLFEIEVTTRGVLQTCDLLKQKYCNTGDARFLDLFKEVRQLVSTKFPPPGQPAR